MRFGVHLSPKDGPTRGRTIGCRSIQIFSGNPRGWSKPPLDPAFVESFRAGIAAAGIDPVVVHATYLINLAAPDDDIFAKSLETFLDELDRSYQLGAAYYVVHSGSHKGMGEDKGRARIVEALQTAQKQVPNRPEILLENTAGTKNSLGTTFEDLALLLDGAAIPRSGVCFDTCHALAAGYEIRTPQGARETLDAFDRALGIGRLKVLHVNDSRGDLNSRIDRHEHIGQGAIGDEGFKAFFADPRVQDLPAILETPLDDPNDDQKNLWRAVELAASVGAVARDALENMPTAALAPIGSKPTTKAKAKAGKKAGIKAPRPPKKTAQKKTGKAPRKKIAAKKPAGKKAAKKNATKAAKAGARKKAARRKKK